MKPRSYIYAFVYLLLVVLALVLAACGPESATPTPLQAAATATLIAPVATATAPPIEVATATSAALVATPSAVATSTAVAAVSPTGPTNDHVADAQSFVSLLAAGNYEAAEATLDVTMTKAISVANLGQLWEGLVQQNGQFKEQLSATSTANQQNGVQYQTVVVTCAFEKANLGIQVTYGPTGKVAGLHVVPAQSNAHVADAQALVSLVATGNYEAAEATFDATMQQAVPVDKLRQTWEGLVQQYGQFKGQLSASGTQIQQNGVQYQTVAVTCAFEKANLGIQVTYGPTGKVAGLQVIPAKGAGPVPTFDPPKVDTSTFTEKQVTVGSGEWSLPGTLTIPNGDGPFPAIVLVHGSGPNDRDETIGPNKPFRDIAWGLASRGVAVLRYDKRTYVYPAQVAQSIQLKTFTYKDETIDDAAAAVSLLSTSDKIDPKRVFVLGHSLGGYLLPRIAQAAPQAAGLVSLAGATRPLEDIILDQYTYIFSLGGAISADEQKQLDNLKQQIALVKSPSLSLDTPSSDLPLGIPASEWLDVRGYDPAQVAKSLKQPMLILQGENDYQVTMQDFQGWKDALSSRSDVTFKSYPKLNHLFMTVEGKSAPDAYSVPGHVLDQVVEDIAGWIKGQ
jgi:dienelactone hydrolase